MKPTQEQVIAWAREAGMERCDCEPRCYLHMGGVGNLTTLATLAYEAGRADENDACAKVCEDLLADELITRTEATVWNIATLDCAAAIRARREQ